MKYKEKKKIIEAMKLIQYTADVAIAEGKGNCHDCFFCDFGKKKCIFGKGKCPISWEIPEFTRWTPEDIALAKVLKALGAKKIARNTKTIYVLTNEDAYALDIDAFQHLVTHESIDIDTIIKEAEE